MFSNERRRERVAAAAAAAKVADRARIEEALAPYERAVAIPVEPPRIDAEVIDLRDVPAPAPPPPARRRRNRPLVYVAAQS